MDESAKQNPSRTIIFSVCFVHFVFLAFILCKAPPIETKKQHKPIVVKTIIAKPQSTSEKKASPAISRSASLPKSPAPSKKPMEKPPLQTKKETPSKKKAPVSEIKKPTEKAKPAPAADKQLAISSSLLRELEESIAKIEEKDDKQKEVKKTKGRPIAPLSLQIDAPEHIQTASFDEDYIASLTEKLHASLHLPDFGEVKIELTLNQDGTVAKLKVLKAESPQNRKYLESELTRLKFPKLSGPLAKQNAHTFILTFCNEL